MTQNLGDEKVLAIQALSANYEKLPNALARARNEKVACSSQVTSSIKVLELQRLWDFFFFLAWLLIRKAQTKTQTVKLKSVRWFSLVEENRAQEERIPGAAIIENETQV